MIKSKKLEAFASYSVIKGETSHKMTESGGQAGRQLRHDGCLRRDDARLRLQRVSDGDHLEGRLNLVASKVMAGAGMSAR